MSETFDEDERAAIAVKMTQTILDDNAFVFASHLKNVDSVGKGCNRTCGTSVRLL